jgi:hypothetical protein
MMRIKVEIDAEEPIPCGFYLDQHLNQDLWVQSKTLRGCLLALPTLCYTFIYYYYFFYDRNIYAHTTLILYK